MHSRPTLTIDTNLYQHYLDNADLTEEQKQELLQTLWSIICEFVMLGFNVHPVQQILQRGSEISSQPDGHHQTSLIEAFVVADLQLKHVTTGEETNANL